MTVLKLTQVGEVSILRRSREPSLRNSANLTRNFGIRVASRGDELRVQSFWRPQRNGPGDCLLKTQVSAKS